VCPNSKPKRLCDENHRNRSFHVFVFMSSHYMPRIGSKEPEPSAELRVNFGLWIIVDNCGLWIVD